jgi:glucose-6-phosphate-specific signal transduction histidine kinase
MRAAHVMIVLMRMGFGWRGRMLAKLMGSVINMLAIRSL